MINTPISLFRKYIPRLQIITALFVPPSSSPPSNAGGCSAGRAAPEPTLIRSSNTHRLYAMFLCPALVELHFLSLVFHCCKAAWIRHEGLDLPQLKVSKRSTSLIAD